MRDESQAYNAKERGVEIRAGNYDDTASLDKEGKESAAFAAMRRQVMRESLQQDSE